MTGVEDLRRITAGLRRRRDRRRAARDVPSYRCHLLAERRIARRRAELGARRDVGLVETKSARYDLASSLGIDVPDQYGAWPRAAEIAWDDLPDRVVVKSDIGSGDRGVLPLTRTDRGWQVVSRPGTVSPEELVARLDRDVRAGVIGPPFLAEELLSPAGGGDRLPDDVKVFAFYGEVGAVLLRRVDRHGRDRRFRLLDAGGEDLQRYYRGAPNDRSIERPPQWEDLLSAARVLSRAVRLPHVRVDLYDLRDRVVFGELTPRPGGEQIFDPAVDRELGRLWEDAIVRLDDDIVEGTAPTPIGH